MRGRLFAVWKRSNNKARRKARLNPCGAGLELEVIRMKPWFWLLKTDAGMHIHTCLRVHSGSCVRVYVHTPLVYWRSLRATWTQEQWAHLPPRSCLNTIPPRREPGPLGEELIPCRYSSNRSKSWKTRENSGTSPNQRRLRREMTIKCDVEASIGSLKKK